MHLKRISKDIRNKIIAGVLAFTMALGGFITHKHQINEIKDLKQQLQLKQQLDSRVGDTTYTLINTKSIETEFNKLCDYKIFSGKINVQHKYHYNRDFILGFKKQGILVGTCDVCFEYIIRLSDAEIDFKNNKLIIMLPNPQLNVPSVHRVKNTLLFTEESKNNIFMNEKDGIELMRSFEDSLDESSLKEIDDYYRLEDKQKELESYAKQEVRNLLNTLGYNKFNVNIKFK